MIGNLKKGSAILIVMLLITVLSAVALTVGYLAMAEVNMEANSEDGAKAYYAAEAGIEDGLLRFRYDNNVEVGNFSGSPKVERINISDGRRMTSDTSAPIFYDITDALTPPSDPTKLYYDLRIKFKEQSDDTSASIDIDDDKKLAKNESIFLEAFDQNVNVTLRFNSEEQGCTGISGAKKCFVQFRQIAPTGTTSASFAGFLSAGDVTSPDITVNVGNILEIKPWNIDIAYKIKAVKIAGGAALELDSGYTTIESTGYAGGAKRKLQAKVDRKSGKLMEVFDFVLNSTSNSINPAP